MLNWGFTTLECLKMHFYRLLSLWWQYWFSHIISETEYLFGTNLFQNRNLEKNINTHTGGARKCQNCERWDARNKRHHTFILPFDSVRVFLIQLRHVGSVRPYGLQPCWAPLSLTSQTSEYVCQPYPSLSVIFPYKDWTPHNLTSLLPMQILLPLFH